MRNLTFSNGDVLYRKKWRNIINKNDEKERLQCNNKKQGRIKMCPLFMLNVYLQTAQKISKKQTLHCIECHHCVQCRCTQLTLLSSSGNIQTKPILFYLCSYVPKDIVEITQTRIEKLKENVKRCKNTPRTKNSKESDGSTVIWGGSWIAKNVLFLKNFEKNRHPHMK